MEPTYFTIGETISWTRRLPAFVPSDGWQLQYYFRSLTSAIDIEAEADEDKYIVNLASEVTAGYAPGQYAWQSFVSRDDKRYLIAEGDLDIKASFADLAHYDKRPMVKKVLDALDAMILGKASRDQMSYSIAGRSLSRLSPSELLQWRDKYKAEYVRLLRQERLNQGLNIDSNIKVQFR